MAVQLIWSPQAIEDIQAIAEYIAKDSPFYAESAVTKIYDKAQHLKEFPQMGRVVPETATDAIREIFVYHYRIIYEIHEQHVNILTVLHGNRMFDEKTIKNHVR